MELSIYYINLSKYPLKTINEIAKFNSLEDMDLHSLKKRGCNKVWLDVKNCGIVATSKSRKNKEDSISISKEFHNRILSMSLTSLSKSYYEQNDDVIKLFKFDLTSDLENIKDICDKYKLSYDTILHNKQENKLRKIWLSDNGQGIVYFENAGWESVVSSYFIDDLKKIKEWDLNIPKGVKINIDKYEVILDVDDILDKISAYGIGSLTVEEIAYMDNH